MPAPEDVMTAPVQQIVCFCRVAVITTAALIAQGCGPKVTMNVQVQDAQGRVQNFTVTNSDSGPTSISVALSDSVTVTSSATYSAGLQSVWVEGSRACPQQSNTFVEPPSGNAIPPGTSPTSFSFAANLGAFNCDYPGHVYLDAAATGNATTGLFGGGPSTNRTQKAILFIPRGHGK